MTTLSVNAIKQILEAAKEFNGKEILISLLDSEENEKLVITHLNKLLQTAVSRSTGFHYINEIIPYISEENLVCNATFWLTKCCDLKTNFSKQHFKLIAYLLKNVNHHQEFHKYMVGSSLQKIIEQCLVTKDSCIENFTCLEMCLQKFGSACLPYKDKIETFLLDILHKKSHNLKMVKQAGRCFHYLQQVGGAGTDGINHKQNWSNTFKKLCNTIHSLYDILLEGIAEYNDYESIAVEPYKFPEFPSSTTTLQMQDILTERAANLILYLQCFLECKYSVTKNIAPQIVLDLVKRCLSTHNCISDNTASVNALSLRDHLIKLQINALLLFRSFIAWYINLQGNSTSYTTPITKLVLDALLQIRKCSCFNSYSNYIIATYKVINYWVIFAKNKLDNSCHNKVITFLLEEIKPEKTCIQLTIKSQINKKQSKKKNNMPSKTNIKKMAGSLTTVQELKCINALQLLSNLFNNISVCIGQEKLFELYNTATGVLLNLQSGTREFPYTNIQCEETLYEVLLSVYEQPFTVFSPPFELSLNIFSHGQNCRNKAIALTCYKGLSAMEKLAQPIYPSLYVNSGSKSTTCLSNSTSNFAAIEEDDSEEEIQETNNSSETNKISEPNEDAHVLSLDTNKNLNNGRSSETNKISDEPNSQNITITTRFDSNENDEVQNLKRAISDLDAVKDGSSKKLKQNSVAIEQKTQGFKEIDAENNKLHRISNGNNPEANEEEDDMLDTFNDVLAD